MLCYIKENYLYYKQNNYKTNNVLVDPDYISLNASITQEYGVGAELSWQQPPMVQCYTHYIITYTEVTLDSYAVHTLEVPTNTSSATIPTKPCTAYHVTLGLLTSSSVQLFRVDEKITFNTSDTGTDLK